MTAALTIARMQLAIALRSPMAWLTAAGFLVLEGVSFASLVAVLADPRRPAPIGAVLEGHFGGTLLSWAIQLTVLAALAARAAEDRRSGQWEALVAAPVSEGAALAGTWLGALALYAILWLPTVLYVVALAIWSPGSAAIDAGPVLAGYLGELVLGGAALALAIAAGAAVRQPMVATVAGFAVLMAWLVVGELPALVPELVRDHPTVVDALDRFAPRPIAGRLARGEVRAADLLWLVGLAASALAAATALVGAGRRRRSRVGLAAYRALLALVAVGLGAVLVERAVPAWDLTRAGRNHLSSGSRTALAALADQSTPLVATVIRPGAAIYDPLYDEAERVLALMARAQPRLRVERWDPTRDPVATSAVAAAAVIDERELVRGGAVILARGPRRRAVSLLDLAEFGRDQLSAGAFTSLRVEQALARAIADLGDDTPRTICVTVGHGELGLDDSGWAAVAARLADDAIAMEVVDDHGLDPVPTGCAAVAILGARRELSDDAQLAIGRYLEAGGHVLVALSGREDERGVLPGSGVDQVLELRGLAAPPAWVVDPAAAVELPLGFRVVDGYADHPITIGFRDRRVTIWQRARPIVGDGGALVWTSAAAYASRDQTGLDRLELTAPIAIAATVERGGSRLVVVSGAEAIGVDPAVRGQGTDLLAARALAWLVGRTPEVAVPPKDGDQLRLVMTAGERRALAAVVIVGLPLVVVALLAAIARRRRRR